MNYLLDTNIFLRYLIGDDQKKARRVKNFFETARQAKYQLYIETPVIIEVAHMLYRYYKLPKADVCDKLRSILALPFIEIEHRGELGKAVEIFAHHGVDFVDAFIFIRAQRENKMLLSFDSEFDNLTPKLRHEP